jgi:serine/threonine-protein kinase
MSILDRLKGIFAPSGGRLDISARFELERHAFSGTMSKFRVAREIATNRRVGLKLLDEEKTKLFNDRFKGLNKPKEAEIGLAIRHPRIVETFEYGLTTTGQEYILMEYVHGPGLNAAINEKKPELVPQRLNFIRQMAEAVQGVHDAGFIHRDICPRNFICHHDFAWLKLIDFGLTVPDKPEFRQPGNRTGTPQYMAPEIVRRRPTDKRVDIFALGVSFYKLLTLEHPWGTTDTTGMAALAHDQRPHRDILEHRPDLDPALAAAINSCLAANADERPESAERFLWMIRGVEKEQA